MGLVPVHSFSLRPASNIKVQFIGISARSRCFSETEWDMGWSLSLGVQLAAAPHFGGYSIRLVIWSGVGAGEHVRMGDIISHLCLRHCATGCPGRSRTLPHRLFYQLAIIYDGSHIGFASSSDVSV